MKNLISLVVCLFLSACATTGNFLDKTIVTTSTSVVFTPETLTGSVDNVAVSIKPIDAQALNSFFYDAALRSAKYNEQFTNILESQSSKPSGAIDVYADIKRNIHEDILQRLNRGEMNGAMAISLIYGLWDRRTYGRTGIESDVINNAESPVHNPYFSNRNYMTVFQIEVRNASNSTSTLELNNFQISSGMEAVDVLNMDHFESVHGRQSLRYDNILRFHMPNTLRIAPNQTTLKYIAAPALTKTDEIRVNYFSDGTSVSFPFKMEYKSNSTNTIFQQYKVRNNQQNSEAIYFYAVELQQIIAFPLLSNDVYINTDAVNDVRLCGISIFPSLWSTSFNYKISCTTMSLSQLSDRFLRIDWN